MFILGGMIPTIFFIYFFIFYFLIFIISQQVSGCLNIVFGFYKELSGFLKTHPDTRRVFCWNKNPNASKPIRILSPSIRIPPNGIRILFNPTTLKLKLTPKINLHNLTYQHPNLSYYSTCMNKIKILLQNAKTIPGSLQFHHIFKK